MQIENIKITLPNWLNWQPIILVSAEAMVNPHLTMSCSAGHQRYVTQKIFMERLAGRFPNGLRRLIAGRTPSWRSLLTITLHHRVTDDNILLVQYLKSWLNFAINPNSMSDDNCHEGQGNLPWGWRWSHSHATDLAVGSIEAFHVIWFWAGRS